MSRLDGVEDQPHEAGVLHLRTQQDCRQRRREREGVEGGDRDGERDGERELLVENAGGSREEADRE